MSIDAFAQFDLELNHKLIKKHPYQYSYCKMCRLDAECFTFIYQRLFE